MAFDDEPALSEFLNLNLEEGSPFFLMQHHYWTNLTKYGFEQPTYSAFSVVCPLCKFGKYYKIKQHFLATLLNSLHINVIRDPLDWFSSHYHFKRYGWHRNPGKRLRNLATDENLSVQESDFESCIMENKTTCSKNSWRYIEFFSGKSMDRENEVEVIHNLAAAKRRLLNNFFVVGILEQFEETLDLFSFMLPKFYKGGTSVYRVVVSTSRIFCKRLSCSVKKSSRVILGRTTMSLRHLKDVIFLGILSKPPCTTRKTYRQPKFKPEAC